MAETNPACRFCGGATSPHGTMRLLRRRACGQCMLLPEETVAKIAAAIKAGHFARVEYDAAGEVVLVTRHRPPRTPVVKNETYIRGLADSLAMVTVERDRLGVRAAELEAALRDCVAEARVGRGCAHVVERVLGRAALDAEGKGDGR
jgi:hypothetical protein